MHNEGQRLAAVVAEIPRSASDVLRRLSAEALLFCGAHSAGVSLRAISGDRAQLTRVGVVGAWARSLPITIPRPSPDSVVIERRQQQLFVDPSRSFRYLAVVQPGATELLVSPLENADGVVGTVWVALHDTSRRFDGEDERRLTLLTQCASAAYRVAGAYRFPAAYPVPTTAAASPRRAMSKREREVCVMVAHGHTNRAIAVNLGVAEKTVETYRARVSDKLGFRNRADFVSYALSHRLLQGLRIREED